MATKKKAANGKKAKKANPPTTMDKAKKKETPPLVLEKAPVPLHSQVLVALMLASFLYLFPRTESIDEVATVETFTNVLFPEYTNLHTIIGFRLLFSYLILYDCVYTIFFGSWNQDTDYAPESKLKSISIPFRGILLQPDRSISRGLLTMSSFTMISWLLLGITFFLAGMIPIFHLTGYEISNWFLRISLLLFECAAPTTLLVSVVVRYALWPMAMENGSANTEILQNPVTLMEHNGNLVMALSEVALLGGLPVRMQDFAVAPLFGILYVFFSWFMMDKWAPANNGPQFCYFFFDTTLGWFSSLALLALLTVLALFYATFAAVDYFISEYSSGILSHVAAILAILAVSCRFSD